MKLENTVLTKTACRSHVKLRAQYNHPDKNYRHLLCTAGRILKAGESSLKMQNHHYIEPAVCGSLLHFAADSIAVLL